MKITFKTLDGRTLNKEFIDANDFIRQQNLEIPAIDDYAKVVEVLIDEKPYDFTGNIADLYFKLNK
ncbi:DUF4649 domain-containing protein [Lactococcus lactis]|uniref:Uncharacterized protein n=1 Tax=Lactococcus lactis subsp. lactis TaxID=1360 RepID=A0A0B8R1S8_LACLL|nr:DUF4649 domain-containing protein [Lactococcus lactis]KST89291.1 hypothetical protein ATCC19435_0313 [Lactococcus lactis subsp. lactis]MBU3886316.1 DUF4649 domain-containing protein [Lactococcus lactis]MCT3119511.1 DUF4649 domain-containing protein [Lactococcus lactis]MDX6024569.1 DUF4649 domain-containing protein [Lactococcus lactis subsp. lactis]PCS19323.1 hypothetical protein RU91_GL000341 [Lactococcus lactis subsp. lactis]